MSVVITLEDIQAYAEVDYIINHMNEKYQKLVPEKLRKFFTEYKDPTYLVKINPYVPLESQGLKKYTLEIIALLHLKYWCEDETRKKELYSLMINNSQKLESQINEKYNIENIFDKEIEESKQDFSTPKVIQKYEQYKDENDDIKDYTDLEESTEENLPTKNEKKDKKSIWKIIKERILSLLKK